MSRFHILSLNCKHDVISYPWQSNHLFQVRKDHILSYLQTTQPLCAGLQEFTDEMHDALMPKLDQYAIFGENRYATPRRLNEQTAILVNTSLASLEQAETIWLTPSRLPYTRLKTSLMPRTCTAARIRIHASGQQFRLYNVHLDVGLPYARFHQARILLEIISRFYQEDGLPFIILGDFNAGYQSKTIMMLRNNEHPYEFRLKDIYRDSPARYQATRHKFRDNPYGNPIDYIFVSQDIIIHDFAIVRDTPHPLSDHFPILADIEIP